jgi:hypothetical protein
VNRLVFGGTRPSRRSGDWLLIAAALPALGCATAGRLNANFDADVVGSAPPSQSPAPTPPADQLTWTTRAPLTSTVVADPRGGNWVRVVPQPRFLADSDPRRLVLIASTEPLQTASPTKLRGRLRLGLSGLGIVAVVLQPTQGGRPGDFLGGLELGNFLGTTATQSSMSSSIDILRSFPPTRIDDSVGLPGAGNLATPVPGATLLVSWSIDQSAGTFSAGAEGGTTQTVPFVLAQGTSIERVDVFVWMQKPSATTALFIDDLFAEEFR